MSIKKGLSGEEARKYLADTVKEFETILEKAQAIADEYGLHFYIQPEYGMGGTYIGKGDEEWNDSSCYGEEDEGRWVSSSDQC